ncbi:helix-turn-helix domain-containing protein [Haloarcula salinisoli]|uniref:Helix-turn-helix domain-containing protein n=1 Tax=Haloarcula salinisoli TaxID=2487746 RepID=A0A8J7YJ81_9EURY|nr:helix-turn-helix domain-containing protein [Halomicroarcula salinisoli]MBX0286804.1 helix-turn-helix domain-containing protein [Halomicroarcula salinisoli]MBX0304104.1 helix-turn-helix domain-containing protein [Halomicroarcula salinisoli]
MKHVRLELDAGGRESEIHPMFDVLMNAPYIERATALQWNWAGGTLGILHYVVGDIDAYDAAASDIEAVIDYELEPAGDDAFYAYIFDEMTPTSRAMFEPVSYRGLVVVPPILYHEDGRVSMSAFGPSEVIQRAIEAVPDPVEATVQSVGGLTGLPQVTESYLSERQQAALEAGLELGYYATPREADQEDVAAALSCAPSTAAEHLRKGERKVIQSVIARQ